MNEDFYRRMTDSINARRYGPGMVNFMDKTLTMLVFIAYPALLIYVYMFFEKKLLLYILWPFFGFLAMSIIRRKINAKRPYEIFDFKPVIKKDTIGNSFPSRHIFSAFLIGMAFFSLNKRAGAEIFILASILSFIRVVGGVHFIKDVLVGAATGLVLGFIGFYLI
jgi:membrane-associated phospholipid phosphatase